MVWEEIIAEGLQDLSYDAIRLLLSRRTARSIPFSAARKYLREQGLWFMDGPATMGGFFEDIKAGLSAESQEILRTLYSALYSEGTDVRTDLDLYAGHVATVINELLALNSPQFTADMADGWDDLGGGRPYASLSANDVSAFKADYDARMAQEASDEANDAIRSATVDVWYAAYNEHISPVLDAEAPTEADLIAGVQAALASLEA